MKSALIASKKKKKPFKTKIKALKQELEKKEREFLELKELLQRVQADFENAMKRKEKEISNSIEKARAETLKEFLLVLDSVSEALKQNPNHKGLTQIKSQLWQVFQKNNVSEIIPDHNFNPETMDCLMRVSVKGKKDNEVLEVFQKGYKYKNYVLRPAKVKVNVSKKHEKNAFREIKEKGGVK